MLRGNDLFWAQEREGDEIRLERKYAMDTEQTLAAATECDYHSDYSAVSKTMLNVFCRSPREYRHMFVDRPPTMTLKPPSKYMELGTICHRVLLEGQPLHEVVAVYDDDCFQSNGSLNSKKAAEFRAAHPAQISVKFGVACTIHKLLESLEQSDLADAIREASSLEKRFDAELCGVACKCKPDIVCDMGPHVLAYDLKFTDDVSDSFFKRSLRRLRYWLQDAHYSAVLAENFQKPVQFRFFAIEPTYPFRVQAYWLDVRSREIARDAHRHKLEELKQCMDSNQWQDRWQSELALSPYDLDEQDQLVEFGEAEEAA